MLADLVNACQMFLVPSAILFAALGVAPTEQLKTLISVMGTATSGIWTLRIWLWSGLLPVDRYTTLALATIFLAAWVVSLIVHARLWAMGRVRTPPEARAD